MSTITESFDCSETADGDTDFGLRIAALFAKRHGNAEKADEAKPESTEAKPSKKAAAVKAKPQAAAAAKPATKSAAKKAAPKKTAAKKTAVAK